jgi:succinoglycan biosynthesis protein ExoM
MTAPAPAPDLSIVVLTYDRPESLAATLRSCLAQTNALGLALELVVIDNHPEARGRAVVDALGAAATFPLRYVGELTRNMSVLRNRGFAEARGPLVAIIDDDEVAAPDWLDQLVGTLRRTGADIAVGPRLARFAQGAPPPYDPDGAQFVRDLGLQDGEDIRLTKASGKPRYGLGTGNTLFDVIHCFPGDVQPMRPEFGDAGGEDAEMFVRLYRQGRRIVWAAKAVVTETVLQHRTTVAYRLLRTRRETQHYVTIYLDAAPRRRWVWLTLMIKGLLQFCAGAVIVATTFEVVSKRRIRGRLLMAHGAGKLSWKRPVGYIAETSQN